MPKLHINVVAPRRAGLPRWIIGTFAVLAIAIVVWGGIQVAQRYRTSHRAASVPVSARSQPPKAESSVQPVAAPAQGPPAKPEPTPAATPPALPATATLRAVRYSANSNSTAVELDLDRPAELHAEALHHPERVFVDLSETSIAAEVGSSSGITTVNVSDARVRRVRIGRRETATRVVLDLNCQCQFSYKMSPSPPYRLVVTVEAQ